MPLHWQPVGPESAATYWRRRAGVALLCLAVPAGALIGGAAVADALRGSDDRLASPDPTAGGESAGEASDSGADPTAEPGGDAPGDAPDDPPDLSAVPVCADDALEVQTTAPVADVAVGSSLTVTLSVRNVSSTPCRRGLGQGAVEVVVTSGEDRIWSSDDCAPGGGEGEVVLEPGASQSARATWPGTRSAPDCPPGQPAAQPGTYRLTGRVGDLQVPGMVFRVQG